MNYYKKNIYNNKKNTFNIYTILARNYLSLNCLSVFLINIYLKFIINCLYIFHN